MAAYFYFKFLSVARTTCRWLCVWRRG